MNRIFLTLASLGGLLFAASFILGMSIEDPKLATPEAQASVQAHLLTALGTLVFAALVHAIVLTYFVGTGRWIEETCTVYGLPAHWREENQSMKFRVLPAIAGCLLLLILTGAMGATADPATPYGAGGWFGIPISTFHFFAASTTICANLLLNYYEYATIFRNGQLIEEVLAEVRRIRIEKGLPV